jgi:integrase/recombinase XerD
MTPLSFFRIEGKGDNMRFLPVGTKAQRLIHAHLETAGHGEDLEGPLFRPVKKNGMGYLGKPRHPIAICQDIVQRYAKGVGITVDVHGFCVHSLRATASDQCARPWVRHRQGAGVARAREYFDHEDL